MQSAIQFDKIRMIVSIDSRTSYVNLPNMIEREKTILDAAVRVFSRYGVKRTTMNDLAREAGISRQTLYNAFRNKDDILRALIRVYSEQAVAEIEAGLKSVEGLGPGLDLAFEKIAVQPFDMIRASPNAEDIVEGFNATSQAELAAAAESSRVVIERILSPHEDALSRAGLSAAGLSDLVQRAAKAAKSGARDRDHLLVLLGALRDLCLAAARS